MRLMLFNVDSVADKVLGTSAPQFLFYKESQKDLLKKFVVKIQQKYAVFDGEICKVSYLHDATTVFTEKHHYVRWGFMNHMTDYQEVRHNIMSNLEIIKHTYNKSQLMLL